MTTVFCAALAAETNTFAPLPTERAHFEEWFLYQPGTHPDDGPNMFTAPLWFAKKTAASRGWTVVEGLCAGALPSGRIVRADYEKLRDQILAELTDAMPVDIVLLGLHGAMAADGYDDCEGDLLDNIRQIVGPSAIIGAELDPHCHLSKAMMNAANLLVAFQEYPHSDTAERGEQLVELADKAHRGLIRPVTAYADARMSAQFFTKQQPALDLVEAMKSAEASGEVLSASLGHSFASGDVADMTVQAWAICDGNIETARAVASRLRDHAWSIRSNCGAQRWTAEAAITYVQKAEDLVILADGTDNPGGGAPGDSTVLLRALLDAKIDGIAAGPIWDPFAASVAAARGEGACFSVRLGGKASNMSGIPLDLEVEVLRVVHDATQRFGGAEWPMGTMVSLRSGTSDIVVASVRNQALSLDVFDKTGVDLIGKKIVLLKSNHHFRDAYQGLSKDILYMNVPGVAVCDPRTAIFKNARRPLWPIDDDDAALAAQSVYVPKMVG